MSQSATGPEQNAETLAAARPVFAPASGEVISHVSDASDVRLDAAVAAASSAFAGWSRTTPRERSGCLLALADALAGDAGRLAAIESRNVGKSIVMARAEVDDCVDTLRFFAGAARCLTAQPSGEYAHGATSLLRREPLGVVGAIVPWNYPLMMAVWKLAPAIAAGNTCVLKPAEQTPLSVLMLAELAVGVLPAGVFEVVTGDGQVGSMLAGHPGVAMVSVTGSVATGRAVAHAAAETGKRVHLELGGNAPVLVFDDANLDAAVQALRTAGYWNAGQECAAACRVIATPGIHDALLDGLVAAAVSIRVGGPEDPQAEMGPVISERQRERVLGFLDRARAGGARVLCGGRPRSPGFFVAPAVVTDVAQQSEIVQSEVFGPVVTVQQATDEDQALAFANDVTQGLSASVWTSDLGRAQRCVRALRFGTVWVNDHLTLATEMPWSGFGASGYGYDQSIHAVEDYTQLKHVLMRG